MFLLGNRTPHWQKFAQCGYLGLSSVCRHETVEMVENYCKTPYKAKWVTRQVCDEVGQTVVQ
jgi:hypothetical protein